MPTIDDTWQFFAAVAVLYGLPVGFGVGVGVVGGLAYGIGSDIAGGASRPPVVVSERDLAVLTASPRRAVLTATLPAPKPPRLP